MTCCVMCSLVHGCSFCDHPSRNLRFVLRRGQPHTGSISAGRPGGCKRRCIVQSESWSAEIISNGKFFDSLVHMIAVACIFVHVLVCYQGATLCSVQCSAVRLEGTMADPPNRIQPPRSRRTDPDSVGLPCISKLMVQCSIACYCELLGDGPPCDLSM